MLVRWLDVPWLFRTRHDTTCRGYARHGHSDAPKCAADPVAALHDRFSDAIVRALELLGADHVIRSTANPNSAISR